MKFSDLEQKAREEQAARAKAAEQEKAEKREAEERATEEFRQEIIAWMSKEVGLNYEELQATLSVVDHKHKRLKLSVPSHTAIIFQVIPADEGYAVRDDQLEVERSYANYTRYCYGLDDALLVASKEWQEREERQAEKAKQKADRETERKFREELAAERGTKYLDLLDDHPILRPILDILGAFLEEREQFAHDLEMAEEFSAGVEARYGEKLEQAQHEADRYARECDDLQRDLWDEQEKLRRVERESKRGW